VVLSDAWVEPAGVDWGSCSVRIPESDVADVAARLEALEPEWPAMSTAARRAYDERFAPETWFQRAVEQCGELLETGALGLRRQWTDARVWARRGRRALRRTA
jgi:hypothetical protein